MTTRGIFLLLSGNKPNASVLTGFPVRGPDWSYPAGPGRVSGPDGSPCCRKGEMSCCWAELHFHSNHSTSPSNLVTGDTPAVVNILRTPAVWLAPPTMPQPAAVWCTHVAFKASVSCQQLAQNLSHSFFFPRLGRSVDVYCS